MFLLPGNNMKDLCLSDLHVHINLHGRIAANFVFKQ